MRIFHAIIFSLFTLSSFSQVLIPYRKGNKWGYCNENKKIIVHCRYDSVSLFKFYGHPPALVIKENKIGFINSKGKLVIPNLYDAATEFYYRKNEDDSAILASRVKKDKQEFYIDTSGKQLSVKKPKEHCIDCVGSLGFPVFKNNKAGYIFFNPPDTIESIYDEVDVCGSGINNLIKAKLNGKWGIVAGHNVVRVPFEYDDLRATQDWRYPGDILYFKTQAGNGLQGIIDEFGKMLIPINYTWIRHEQITLNGARKAYFTVCKDSLNGVFNDSGKIIIPLQYKSIRAYNNNMFAVQSFSGYYGLLGYGGKVIVSFKYAFTYAYDNGIIIAYDSSFMTKYGINYRKAGVYSSEGKEILPAVYDNVYLKPWPNETKGKICIIAVRDSLCSIWDDTGKLLLAAKYAQKDFAPMYASIEGQRDLYRVYFCVRENGLCGLLDDSSKKVLPYKYLKIELFQNNSPDTPGEKIAKVQTANGKWGYVNLNGVEYFEE